MYYKEKLRKKKVCCKINRRKTMRGNPRMYLKWDQCIDPYRLSKAIHCQMGQMGLNIRRKSLNYNLMPIYAGVELCTIKSSTCKK